MANQMVCPQCGGAIHLPEGKTVKFCGGCGAKVEAPVESMIPGQPTGNPMQVEPLANPDISAQDSGYASPGGASAIPYASRDTYAPQDPYTQQNAHPSQNQYAPQDGYAPMVGEALDYTSFQPEDVPKKGLLKPLLIGAVSVAAVALVAVLVLFVVAPLMSGSSYQKAETNFINSLFAGKNVAAGDKGQKLDFDVFYEASGDMGLGFSDIGLSGSLSTVGQEALANLLLTMDGQTVTKADAFLKTDEVGVAFPGLTRYYIRVLTDSLLGGSGNSGQIDWDGLDQEKLKTTFSDILKAYFKAVEPVTEVETGVELSGGDVTIKCDMYTITFDGEALTNFLKDAIAELKKNQDLMDFITQIADGYGGMPGDLEDLLDEALDQLDDLADLGRLFRMTVWVQGDKIVARTVDKIRGVNDLAFSYQVLEKSGKRHVEGKLKIPYTGIFSLSGDFERSGGAWNGSLKLTAKDDNNSEMMSFTAKCTELKVEGGKLTGSIRLTGAISGSDISVDIKLVFDKNGDKQTIKLTGSVSDGYQDIDLGTLTMAFVTSAAGELDFSRFDTAHGVVSGDYSGQNVERAQAMYDELDDKYWDEDDPMISSFIYTLRSYANNIIWIADWSWYD